MRKLCLFFLIISLIFAFAITASADTAASQMVIDATVNQDGVCKVKLNVSVRLEEKPAELTFPVPEHADHVTLDGERVRTRHTAQGQLIDLMEIAPKSGEFSFSVTYNLTEVVQTSEAGTPQVQLELMSGFAYPIEHLEFTVRFPGEITTKPAFSSGYHGANIELDLSAAAEGDTVSGNSSKIMKDHETLVMKLDVTEEMFPSTTTTLDNALFDDIAMAVCGILALLYWIFFLRAAPLKANRSSTPPDGYSGGELGSVLTMQGADLNGMILTWAQLGYVLIQLDRNDRVLLHKRMDMGNERCGFEQKCFRALFAGKRVVDTSSARYCALQEKYNVLSSNVKSLLSRKSGNPRLFRLLCAGIGTFGGVAIGVALGSGAALQWLLAIVMGILGSWLAWQIHPWANGLFVLNKRPVWKGFFLCAIWVLLGFVSGVPTVGCIVAGASLLAGLMAAFGSRRTEFGKHAACQVLGFRHYLKKMDKQELRRICAGDPDFFHNVLPYALALGMDKTFAMHFGNQEISCPSYLTYGMNGEKTAMGWCHLMRKVLHCMDRRRRQMPLEQFQRILDNLKK